MTTTPEKKVEKPEVETPEAEAPVPIAKPGAFSLDKFKSKRAAAKENVTTLQGALPIYRIAEAKDYVRVHDNVDAYWSHELCFCNVPIKGARRDSLHLIDEELAMKYLPPARIQRFRLALATKPYDVFFLCQIPTQNLDNPWNMTNLQGCEQAMKLWTQVTSRKEEGVESYHIGFARNQDAFPDPKWPSQSLLQLIEVSFPNRMIEHESHPGLLRLLGAKQVMS